ncbi:WS/DGAT domain-containing protein [Nocardia sp. BMG51109]|uniref:WS/DGAT domain-containing protein n=1 Tax=Nocardia sp. BMG51109 TaxID=1056816 RepID=UPI0018DB96CF|nr:WS/DGAT domain-containing protein [Nocardia sp. BMG51109]
MDALTPQDATRYWLSHRTCNDLFLLYCFTDTGRSADDLRASVAARSARIPDLSVRVRERRFGYPVRVPRGFTGDQVVEHRLDEPGWPNVVAALGDLLGEGVRADEYAWRLHLFRGVVGAPGGADPALVAVLQLSHALADGQRAAAVARALFAEGAGRAGPVRTRGVRKADSRSGFVSVDGGDAAFGSGGGDGEASVADRCSVPRVAEPGTDQVWPAHSHARRVHRRRAALAARLRDRCLRRALAGTAGGWLGRVENSATEAVSLLAFPVLLSRTVVRGFAAEGARRELASRAERGEVPPAAPGFPPTLLNQPPEPAEHVVRMLVRDDLKIPGYTVTVVVLTAVASALNRYLKSPEAELAAQVSMAVPSRNSRSHNNYRDLGIALHGAEPDPRRRADRIAADLDARRARAEHPLLSAQDRVTDVLPASVLRRDVATYPIDQVPDALSGHTVVSSVNRGPADLTFGGGPVRFTAGFPALGAVMHLTHGVHGLGRTVTVSVHADPAVVPDIDAYAGQLDAALTEVLEMLGDGPKPPAGH